MKTHFKKLRNPNYLGSWDLLDQEDKYANLTVTVADVKKEFVHDGKGGGDECVVIYFDGKKPMVMNSTNLKTVSKLLDSPFIEDWKGKQIELTVAKVKAFGEMHDALRVSKAKPTAPKVKQDFTSDKFEAAFKNKATIERIKELYNVSPEIQKEYENYIAGKTAS